MSDNPTGRPTVALAPKILDELGVAVSLTLILAFADADVPGLLQKRGKGLRELAVGGVIV